MSSRTFDRTLCTFKRMKPLSSYTASSAVHCLEGKLTLVLPGRHLPIQTQTMPANITCIEFTCIMYILYTLQLYNNSHKYIHIPGTQMTLILIGKDLLLEAKQWGFTRCKTFSSTSSLSLFPADLGGRTLQLGCFTADGGCFMAFFLDFLGVPLLVVGRGGRGFRKTWVRMVFCVY